MGNTSSSTGPYSLYADVYTNQIKISRTIPEPPKGGAGAGTGAVEDKSGARGATGACRRRFPLPSLCVAYLAQYLDHYSLSSFAASTPALSHVINGPGSPFWEHLCSQRWHPGLPRSPRPVPQEASASAAAAGDRPGTGRAAGPDTEPEPHWRLRFVQHDMLALEGEIEHIEASRYPMTDIAAFVRTPRSRRGGHGSAPAAPGHGVVGLFADFAAFEDPLVASAMGEVVHRSLKTLVVLNNDAITDFRTFQRLRSRPAPVSFLPIDVFERYGEDIHEGGVPNVAAPGFIGWAHELALLRPEHERYRGVLRHVLRDGAVFDTREHADAWLTSANPAKLPPAWRLYTVALDEAAQRLEAAAPSPVPWLRFSTQLRDNLFEPPDARIEAVRATRMRCLASMKAMCERQHRTRLKDAGPARQSPDGRATAAPGLAGPATGSLRVDVGESVGASTRTTPAAAAAAATEALGPGAAVGAMR